MQCCRQRRMMAARWVAAALCVVWGGTATGTEFRSGEAVQIVHGDILDDLIATGGNVNIESHIVGDAIALARTVTLGDSGAVDNSLIAGGQKIDVNGTVSNSARLFAQNVTVRGHIERNLMAFAQSVVLDSRSWVEKDVYVGTSEAIIRGRIGGDLRGEAGTMTVYGQVDGDIRVTCDHLIVMPTAIVGGALKYTSEKAPKIEEGAQILGGVERVPRKEKPDEGYTLGCFFWDAWWYLGMLVVGIVLLILFRPFVDDVKMSIRTSSWKSLGVGFLFLICMPIVAVALALTLIGIPVAIAIVVGWAILLYLSMIFVALPLGEWLLLFLRSGRKISRAVSLIVGLVILMLAVRIPYVGFLARVMIFSLALGGFFLTAYRYRTRAA
ncbi:MAG: polymer-forming cytoskeletal protein [Candidatus Zixiibacteriota bacterium]